MYTTNVAKATLGMLLSTLAIATVADAGLVDGAVETETTVSDTCTATGGAGGGGSSGNNILSGGNGNGGKGGDASASC